MTALPLSTVADTLLERLHELSDGPTPDDLTGHQLMAERAALAGLTFKPGQSPGGSCRLLTTRDGIIALNLPREDDWAYIPALVQQYCAPPEAGDWDQIQSLVAGCCAGSLVTQGRMLGLAVSASGERSGVHAAIRPDHRARHPADGPTDQRTNRPEIGSTRAARGSPRVIDLSGLWAGPLASHLLWRFGADVIKVESSTRPDGARSGPPEFYGLLHQGKRSVALDLRMRSEQLRLKTLITRADIVIESSRPRALRQMGIIAEDIIAANPSLTWVSITGHGRDAPQGDWIGYGDDAGIAAGLGEYMRRACGTVQFAGDAIADPLTGITVACAALSGWQRRGGGLVSISLTDVVARAIDRELAIKGPSAFIEELGAWWQEAQGSAPQCDRRAVTAPVAALGEHTREIIDEFALHAEPTRC